MSLHLRADAFKQIACYRSGTQALLIVIQHLRMRLSWRHGRLIRIGRLALIAWSYVGAFTTWYSMRRFFSRPSEVSLLAIGSASP
jgi:hypothetical protein